MLDNAAPSQNGKIKMAVLGERLNTVIIKQEETNELLRDLTKGFNAHLQEAATRQAVVAQNCEDIKDVKGDIKHLSRRSYTMDGIVAALSAVGSVLAGIFGANK